MSNDNNRKILKKIESFNSIYDIQEFVPIYNELGIKNLDNPSLVDIIDINYSNIKCNILDNNDCRLSNIFCKYAPIIDPIRFMIGKYVDDHNFVLPTNETSSNIKNSKYQTKINRTNNSAYIDGYFSYLSSTLKNKGFINGIDFYGMYLCKNKEFRQNIIDDIEFLDKSNYFHDNINVLFNIDENELFELDSNESGNHINKKINISNEDININIDNSNTIFNFSNKHDGSIPINEIISLNELNNNDLNIMDETITLNKTESDSESLSDNDNSDDTSDDESNEDSDECSSDDDDDDDDDITDEENEIIARIKDFPVLMILTEKCHDTLDNLMIREEITCHEWESILIQIIITLITYQKQFKFTHNDLHTSNIMYIHTELEYIYYKYQENIYKVPTYGKIFKIIDFGRSIYTMNDKLHWSDNYLKDEDAYSQYNFEPFYDESKDKIENNFSFDLCRLACSLYDYFDDIENKNKGLKSLTKLITYWCSDKNNKNLLYNKKGGERYPEFKLYRIISKNIHHCIPNINIQNDIFKKFIIPNDNKNINIIDIDNL